jgi:hypothetical protein
LTPDQIQLRTATCIHQYCIEPRTGCHRAVQALHFTHA